MSNEIPSRVHEGGIQVSHANRVGLDRRATFPSCHVADVPRLEAFFSFSFRDCCSTDLPGEERVQRLGVFAGGEWASLLASVQESSTRGGQAFCRRQRRSTHDATENRAARAEALAAPRQALERGAVDPGNTATLAALQNPQRRPPILRDSMPADIADVAALSCLILGASQETPAVRDVELPQVHQA